MSVEQPTGNGNEMKLNIRQSCLFLSAGLVLFVLQRNAVEVQMTQ